MTNLSYAPKARAHLKNREHAENQLLLARIQNVGTKFIEALHNLPQDQLMEMLTLKDEEFWTELKTQAQLQQAINVSTPEKQEQEDFVEARMRFMETLKKYGGVHKSTKVAEILGTSVPTVHKYGKNGKIIELDWGKERLYPVFQFCVKEDNNEVGMLKGVPELLSRITHNVSAVRVCNFFTRKNKMPVSGELISAIEILRRGANSEEMAHLSLLAENFGTNHTM